MPTNHTEHYSLSQWEAEDKVLRTDFNEDNAKIDRALGAHAALLAGLEARKGNCRIECRSYVGTGNYGPEHPTVITFSRKPLSVIIFGNNQCMLDSPALPHYILLANGEKQNSGTHYSTWTDKKLSFYSNTASSTAYYPDNAMAQMNSINVTYCALLFFAADE